MRQKRGKVYYLACSTVDFWTTDLWGSHILKGSLPEAKRRGLAPLGNTVSWENTLTVRDLIWPLPLLINHNDNNKNYNLRQNPQEGPQRSQVTANTQDGFFSLPANRVGCIAFIHARILIDVQVHYDQFSVVLFIGNEEAASNVFDGLRKSSKRTKAKTIIVSKCCR